MANNISVGDAWTEAAAFVRREKRLLAPLVLALMVLPVSVSQLIQPGNPLAAGSGMRAWMAVAALALLIGLGGQMAVSRMAMGWSGSLGGVIRLALTRLPTVIAALILFFLCLSVVLIPVMIVLALVTGGASQAAAGGGAGNGVDGLAMLLILAFVPRIMLAPGIAMAEAIGPWALVKKAWTASRGRYWRLLGFFLIFLAGSLILALAASAVFGSLAVLAFGKPEPMSLSRLIVALAGGLVQGAVATVYSAMVGRMVVQALAGAREPAEPTTGI